MSAAPEAYIVGAWEHPLRLAPNHTTPQLHAECAAGALADAGLSKEMVDGYFCAGDAPGWGGISMADYMGLNCRYTDSTDLGGPTYIAHVARAARAIADGKCSVALITLAGRPRSDRGAGRPRNTAPEGPFEWWVGADNPAAYGMCTMRHMHQYGTTAEQLAWIKVAASHHAQHNEHALLREVVTVEDVLNSPMIAEPTRRLDCCVTTDGGGALIVTSKEIARSLKRPLVKLKGSGEGLKAPNGGLDFDLLTTAAAKSGPPAFAQAGVKPSDIKYASIYDSFTITVLLQLENLGFCAPGEGGKFVQDGGLISGVGKLPFNTDGGGLCNNHPSFRGGITKVIEAVRQLRGEAHPAVQVKNCDLALATGIGFSLGLRHTAATIILERE